MDSRSRLGWLADVDPLGPRQRGHAVGRDPHGAVGGARRRHHLVEGLQADVAIDRERRGEAEGADAADRVPRQGLDLFLAEHARLAAQRRLGLPVVEPGIAARNDEAQAGALSRIADALEERIGDCLAAVGESRGTAETFGNALHVEAGRLSSDPKGTIARIIGLTEAAVTAARLVEGQLHHAREEADALRNELHRARQAAEHDHLTGLPNRRSFEQRLREAGGDAVVALIDIDDFKQVNDRFGHPAGDRVLRFFAAFVRAGLPRDVVLARYGGEEFALLFKGMSLDQAVAALDIVR